MRSLKIIFIVFIVASICYSCSDDGDSVLRNTTGRIVAIFGYFMSRKGLSGGGGASNTAAGAIADLLNAEKRNAMDYVMEEKSGKKMEEQESGEKE